jgi:Fic family protein
MRFNPTRPHDLSALPPRAQIRNEQFIDLLLKTRTELGELNGYSVHLPNPLLLLSPAVLRESVASSSIENINTTVEQVLQMQLFPEAERKQPDKEVLKYRDAILWGYENLKKIPISTRLIHGIHKRLLPEHSNGYRRTQNAIQNTSTGEVLYTPPPAQDIPKLMSNWERFINDDSDGTDPLVKCAIAHYQFEAIHPFRDGNGRVGRILVVLSLIQEQLLTLPILYISGYINKHRADYYRLLRGVTANSQWSEFITFMLQGFNLQARETKGVLLDLMRLLEETKERVRSQHRKIYSGDLIEALFAYPIITPVSLGKRIDVNYRTASRYLAELAKANVLAESYAGRYHLFINKPLLGLLKE